MSSLTDVDWDVLIDLTFEPPCGMSHNGEPCTESAEWWGLFKKHHPSPERPTFEVLMCPFHYEFVVDGNAGKCVKCGGPVVFLDNILQLERIKP